MIFVDASAYLSSLLPRDPNREQALKIIHSIEEKREQLITSYAILGEVLTISSQRYDREKGIRIVEDLMRGRTQVVIENSQFVELAYKIFRRIKDKDVSWVDCYSFAIIENYKIEKVFSFDRDFNKYTSAKVLA